MNGQDGLSSSAARAGASAAAAGKARWAASHTPNTARYTSKVTNKSVFRLLGSRRRDVKKTSEAGMAYKADAATATDTQAPISENDPDRIDISKKL